MVSLPKPSIFIALRETKCSILPLICGGQLASFGQRHAASPSTRTNFAPHSGQFVGNVYTSPFASRLSPFSSRPTTFGIISPPFSTQTISPSRMSNWRMKSSLCKVARCTVVPESCTGSRLATGVTTPVLPT